MEFIYCKKGNKLLAALLLNLPILLNIMPAVNYEARYYNLLAIIYFAMNDTRERGFKFGTGGYLPADGVYKFKKMGSPRKKYYYY